MHATEEIIRGVVAQVLAQMNSTQSHSTTGSRGVFGHVDGAVSAAKIAQREFERRSIAERKQAVDCIRKICVEHAEELGKEELSETKIGKLKHKIEKLQVVADRIPGTEFLRTDAYSGTHGVTLEDFAPFGVIGAITPVTHSLPTLACNAINMLASGNSLVVNPHPSGAKIASKGTRLFNDAIYKSIGIDNLISIVATPTLESAQAIFDHPDVRLICVTGGPAVARAALRSPKRAIVAGPGNPPVVVDETADLENAAKSIIAGAAYDNNLLCIGEKEVFAVDSIFDELCEHMKSHKAIQLTPSQIDALTRIAFIKNDQGQLYPNKELVGQDPVVLAGKIGLQIPEDTELLFGETNESNPFVSHEQMMTFVPFVRVPDVNIAISLAKKYEHGYRHTSIIHSRNIETITRMGREMDTTLFIQNGPSVAGLGSGGEGYLSFSIATPTGEGVTTPLTFTRIRRSTTVGSLRVV
jgi:aldehyde dehydrogenase